jgi:hypothetical protein
VRLGLENIGSSLVRTLSGGKMQPPIAHWSSHSEKRSSMTHVNLGRILKTLVHVHGVQMLLNGVYNADPHPGNVLVLPDGR